MKKQSVQWIISFIVKLFANAKLFGFYITPLSRQCQYVMYLLNYILF